MIYDPSIKHSKVLDSMPGVIRNVEEFIEKVKVGDTFYLTSTDCGKPSGFWGYILRSHHLNNYINQTSDYMYPGFLTDVILDS